MNWSPQFVSLVCGANLRRILVLAFLVGAGWATMAHAQSSTPDTLQTVPATLPDDPPPAPGSSTANTAQPAQDSGTSDVVQDRSQKRARPLSGGKGEDASQWNRSMLDPFEPGPGFGKFADSPSGENGLNGPNGMGAFGGRQDSGGPNSFGGSGTGERKNGGPRPLFPLVGGANGSFGGAPLALPSLNQLMRGSFNLPVSSSSNAFRLSYQDSLRPRGSLGDLERPSASAMFTTSDLGNGIFLSAGTTYGSHMAGAPAATLGNGSAGGPKHPGPGVAIKLSF